MFSSDWFSGRHTGAILLPALRLLLPGASEATVHLAHGLVRKAAHFTEYAVLAVLLVRALQPAGRLRARAAVLAVVLGALLAGADELHQAFVPSRTAALRDVLVDVAGVAAGVGAVAVSAGPRRLTARPAA